jgi:hypothetical protein
LEAAQASNPALGSAVKTSKADHTVTGSVKDSEGAPLAGVTIRIKNSKIGTTTKADGTFTLNAPTGKETLIISSIGYKTQEVTLADRKIVNVILDSETSSLDEVVVVGYGQQKKIHLTGAVAQIDMKAIEDLPVGSLSAALVAQQPGVGVSGGFARPGDPASITIRNPTLFSKDGGTFRHCM